MKAPAFVLIACALAMLTSLTLSLRTQNPIADERAVFAKAHFLPTGPAQADCSTMQDASPGADSRRYGWCRLKEVLTSDEAHGLTPWYDWSTKCYTAPDPAGSRVGDGRVFLSRLCKALGLNPPVRPQLSSAMLTKRQNLGTDTHLASVFYNPVATDSIINNGLSLPSSPPDPLAPVQGQTLAIKPFDTGSVVVKAIWEVVQQNSTQNWPVAIYDPQNPAFVKSGGAPAEFLLPPTASQNGQGWPTIVDVDIQKTDDCNDPRGNVLGVIPLGSTAPTIPLGCFHFIKVTPKTPEADFVRTTVQGSLVSSGDYYLLLVGMHVAKKEASGWTWTTFWWTNRPDFSGGAAFSEQPSDLPVPYKHFAMNTTVSGQHSVYNPYLEGPESPNGTQSNCAFCHSKASIVINQDTSATSALGGSPARPGNSRSTDFMWSIAAARDKAPDYF